MTPHTLTERQHREREFYDEFARRTAPRDVSFDPVAGMEHRPWNPHWRLYEIVRQRHGAGARRLLDFGCGPGRSSSRFAYLGYEVQGFDIAPENIAVARRLAEQHGLSDRVSLQVAAAETVELPDAYFDVVAGFDILHHVDIARSIATCLRVLRPGGIAVFSEPLRVPVFDALRNTRLVRRLVPNDMSFDRHITQDERKLTSDDLETLRRAGAGLEIERFLLCARLDRFVRRPGDPRPSVLERFDRRLFQSVPALQVLGGYGVLTVHKSR